MTGTETTDGGLESLKGFRQLTELDLDGTRVTDAGLEHLKELPQLKTLLLDPWQVTDAGVAELCKALPGCFICRVVRNTTNVFVRRAPR